MLNAVGPGTARRSKRNGRSDSKKNDGAGGSGSNGSNGSKNGKLDLGDFLGRSKDGFQRVKTEEDDEDLNGTESESDDDDLEEFSVPALRA